MNKSKRFVIGHSILMISSIVIFVVMVFLQKEIPFIYYALMLSIGWNGGMVFCNYWKL
jgi:hypothetical protein